MNRTALLAALATIAILAGCAGSPGSGAPDQSISGDWVLTSGTDAAGPFVLDGTSITLTIAEGQGGNGEGSGGRTPCNHYFATITGGDDTISITGIGQTEAACVDADLMDLERRYLSALGATNRAYVELAEIGGSTLRLVGDETELSYQQAVPPPVADLAGTMWKLESVMVGTGDDGSVGTVLGNGYIQFTEDGSFNGNAGCRDFAGEYTVSGAELTPSRWEFAAADCLADFVDQENHVATVLEGFVAEIDGDVLTLTNARAGLGLMYRAG